MSLSLNPYEPPELLDDSPQASSSEPAGTPEVPLLTLTMVCGILAGMVGLVVAAMVARLLLALLEVSLGDLTEQVVAAALLVAISLGATVSGRIWFIVVSERKQRLFWLLPLSVAIVSALGLGFTLLSGS